MLFRKDNSFVAKKESVTNKLMLKISEILTMKSLCQCQYLQMMYFLYVEELVNCKTNICLTKSYSCIAF